MKVYLAGTGSRPYVLNDAVNENISRRGERKDRDTATTYRGGKNEPISGRGTSRKEWQMLGNSGGGKFAASLNRFIIAVITSIYPQLSRI